MSDQDKCNEEFGRYAGPMPLRGSEKDLYRMKLKVWQDAWFAREDCAFLDVLLLHKEKIKQLETQLSETTIMIGILNHALESGVGLTDGERERVMHWLNKDKRDE